MRCYTALRNTRSWNIYFSPNRDVNYCRKYYRAHCKVLFVKQNFNLGRFAYFTFYLGLRLMCFRELRKHRPGKILFHLCCNLCISYVVFASGVSNAIENPAGCTAVTFLLHYFLLVSWTWMGAYSYEMYIEVVKVTIVLYSSVVWLGSKGILTIYYTSQLLRWSNFCWNGSLSGWIWSLLVCHQTLFWRSYTFGKGFVKVLPILRSTQSCPKFNLATGVWETTIVVNDTIYWLYNIKKY